MNQSSTSVCSSSSLTLQMERIRKEKDLCAHSWKHSLVAQMPTQVFDYFNDENLSQDVKSTDPPMSIFEEGRRSPLEGTALNIPSNENFCVSPMADYFTLSASPLTASTVNVIEQQYDLDTWRMFARIQASRHRMGRPEEYAAVAAAATTSPDEGLTPTVVSVSGIACSTSGDNSDTSRNSSGILQEQKDEMGVMNDDGNEVVDENETIFDLELDH